MGDKMKKIKISILVLLICMITFSKCLASDILETDIKIKFNDLYINFEEKPILKDSRLLVPVRDICNLFGLQVDWNPIKKSVTCINNEKKIEFFMDNNQIFVDGIEEKNDVDIEVYKSRMYVPLRFLVKSLGNDIKWDGVKKESIINVLDEEGRKIYYFFNNDMINKYIVSINNNSVVYLKDLVKLKNTISIVDKNNIELRGCGEYTQVINLASGMPCISIKNSNDIKLSNLEFINVVSNNSGAGVIDVEYSNGIIMDKIFVKGPVNYAVYMGNTENLSISNSNFYKCSPRVIYGYNSKGINLVDTNINNSVSETSNIKLENVTDFTITGGEFSLNGQVADNSSLFELKSSNLVLKNVVIKKNGNSMFFKIDDIMQNRESHILMFNIDNSNNIFDIDTNHNKIIDCDREKDLDKKVKTLNNFN